MPSSSPTSSAPTTTIEVGRLGYLQSHRLSRRRLVVDTGLHAKRWTREQGVDFFASRTARPAEVASEVDRYCSWPGQACGYEIGHSEINRQRDPGEASAGLALRPQGVRRCGGPRRQRADGRAGQERRRLYRPGEGPNRPSPALPPPRGSRRESGLRARSAAPTRAPGSCRGSRARRTSARAWPRLRSAAAGSSARRSCRTAPERAS